MRWRSRRPIPGSSRRPSAEIFGYTVHHALRARFCIERGRPWQAAYWIDETRGLALSLACRSRGLPDGEGRGFDDLPGEVLERFHPAMYVSLEPDELLRALRASLEGLLKEAGELAERVEPLVRGLGEGWCGERAEG